MTKLNRYGIAVWFGIGVGAVGLGLGAATANAALPPLPAAWPVASTMVEAREAPLPPGVPDGAIDDAIDGAAGRAASHAQTDRTHEAAAPGASPPPFEHASRVAQHAQPAAPAPALEGPPIPLPPPARMNDAAAHRTGDADDTRRISLNLQRADLTAAFDAFARFTGLNIVVSEQVRGTVTFRLNNVRWRDAFDTLLDTHGLAMSRRGDIVWVTPAAELAVRERERFETHARA
ncbi:secretin and TonB N-terminal domain-containing protein, partial [Burkholderia multivorans]